MQEGENMNSFELIEKYLPQAVDKYFFEESKSAILETGKKFIDVSFDETGYVKIATFLLDGLSDYYQTQQVPQPTNPEEFAAYAGNVASGSRDGFGIGGASIEFEIYKLQWKRSRQFRIDYISNEETAGTVIGNALEEFNRSKVIPEVDVSRFSLIADKASASLGNLAANVTIAANEVIGKFNAAFEWMTEHEVPADDQIIFVNPSVMTLIRNTSELTKQITQADYRSPAGIDFKVEKYAGRPIIEVPSNRFFTNVLLTNNGYRAQSSSKIINFMVISTKAVVPIRKLEWNKIYGPDMSGLAGFHGYLINYLLYHGVIVPRNKIVGCYVNVSGVSAGTKVNTLAVDTRAGAVANHYHIANYYTSPAGLRGGLFVSYTAEFVLGANISAHADGAAIGLLENKDADANTEAYFGLVDDRGVIIATTGSTAVAITKGT